MSSENGQRALSIFCSRIYCAGEYYDYEYGSRYEGRLNLFDKPQWIRDPPLLCCWKKLVSAVELNDSTPSAAVDAVRLFCLGVLKFFADGKRYAVSYISSTALHFALKLPKKLLYSLIHSLIVYQHEHGSNYCTAIPLWSYQR